MPGVQEPLEKKVDDNLSEKRKNVQEGNVNLLKGPIKTNRQTAPQTQDVQEWVIRGN